MNSKQCRSLRKAIKEQYPNADSSVIKKIYKEGKRQYKNTNNIESNNNVIVIK